MRDGHGYDAFSEAFPLANLLVVNPADPKQVLRLKADGFSIDKQPGSVAVLKDGSDGKEAIIRVQGHSGYMFDVVKFLNRDFLESMIKGLSFGVYDADTLIDMLYGLLGVNLFGLLNRLQVSFEFTTDYVLHPGEDFLTMRTTIVASPPTDAILKGCGPVPCDKDCPAGFVMKERVEPDPARNTPYLRMCPVCECAAERKGGMPTLNEGRDIFKILLGDPAAWADPNWKGGIMAGDFLFYGADADCFVPGFGYDIDRKIFEDLYQGVGTLGSPVVGDWVAATAENVSYAWTSINPDRKDLFDCPAYRLAVMRVDPLKEDEVAGRLATGLGISPKDAAMRVRQNIADHRPIPLKEVPMTGKDPGAGADRKAAFDAWAAEVLAGTDGAAMKAMAGDGAVIGLLPRHDCMPSQVMIPVFSTSATAVLTHFIDSDRMTPEKDGTLTDRTRAYSFERYLSVGDGDVASALRPVFALRKTPHGEVAGLVVEEGSGVPIHHANVFVLADYRADPAKEPAPATYREYRAKAQDAWAKSGFVSQMQTDLGAVPAFEGEYAGPLEPGRYFVVAHTRDRGSSALVPITVTEGRTVRVHLALPAPGKVEYRLLDQGGQEIPARLTFRPLDAQGLTYDWDGKGDPELGDSRHDHGVYKIENSAQGKGIVALPPGRYEVIASRGFEYGIDRAENVEVRAGLTTPLEMLVVHEMDTSGHISADFHVHADPSVDSGLLQTERVKAAVAEGLEFYTSTDHDHLVDYTPFILSFGLERYLKTQVGEEISPLEYGHFNAYPMKYDDTAGAVHDPVPWPGHTMSQIWQAMRDRADAPMDAFVLQVSHPRDGFMGYFQQIGMKGYDLQRKTPGMEMCNKVLEATPCDFDAIELMNGKDFHYLHTPTVGEVDRHNRCLREIIAARDPAKFARTDGQPPEGVCLALQEDPGDGCDQAAARAAEAGLGDDEAAERIRFRDHCQWHKAFRDAIKAGCPKEGATLLGCKRAGIEAVKNLSVRYMMERTPSEVEAWLATTATTDVGCSLDKAMMGCTAEKSKDVYPAGCGGTDKCVCEACVCAARPECCKEVSAGGTGWDPTCAGLCRTLCHGCEDRPCTDRQQPFTDWFALMDAGFVVTAVGNSDSHNVNAEIGLPRNWVAMDSDRVTGIDRDAVNRAVKNGKVVVSTGPMIDFSMAAAGKTAGVSGTLDASGSPTVQARIRVQTASWFKVDRIEIWSNSRLAKTLFPDQPKEAVFDFDGVVELPKPAKDAWYVVIAYGLNDPDQLAPVFKRKPYGSMLISTIISLGAQQLLASFGDLVDSVSGLIGSIDSLTNALELPDSTQPFPYAVTNPIRVDWDGGGFRPVAAMDTDNDGRWDLPPFCLKPCTPVQKDGKDTQADCGENQTCVTDPKTGKGECRIPIPEHCVGLQPIGG
jgi:hypothetical protein